MRLYHCLSFLFFVIAAFVNLDKDGAIFNDDVPYDLISGRCFFFSRVRIIQYLCEEILLTFMDRLTRILRLKLTFAG